MVLLLTGSFGSSDKSRVYLFRTMQLSSGCLAIAVSCYDERTPSSKCLAATNHWYNERTPSSECLTAVVHWYDDRTPNIKCFTAAIRWYNDRSKSSLLPTTKANLICHRYQRLMFFFLLHYKLVIYYWIYGESVHIDLMHYLIK